MSELSKVGWAWFQGKRCYNSSIVKKKKKTKTTTRNTTRNVVCPGIQQRTLHWEMCFHPLPCKSQTPSPSEPMLWDLDPSQVHLTWSIFNGCHWLLHPVSQQLLQFKTPATLFPLWRNTGLRICRNYSSASERTWRSCTRDWSLTAALNLKAPSWLWRRRILTWKGVLSEQPQRE